MNWEVSAFDQFHQFHSDGIAFAKLVPARGSQKIMDVTKGESLVYEKPRSFVRKHRITSGGIFFRGIQEKLAWSNPEQLLSCSSGAPCS